MNQICSTLDEFSNISPPTGPQAADPPLPLNFEKTTGQLCQSSIREPVLPPPDFDPDSLELGVGISIEELLEQQKQRPAALVVQPAAETPPRHSPPGFSATPEPRHLEFTPELPGRSAAFSTTPEPLLVHSLSPVTAEQKLAAFNEEVSQILRPFKEEVDNSWHRLTADHEAGGGPSPAELHSFKKTHLAVEDEEGIFNNIIQDADPFHTGRKAAKLDHQDRPPLMASFPVPINRRPTVTRTRSLAPPLSHQPPTDSPAVSNRVRQGAPKPHEISTLPSFESEVAAHHQSFISTTPLSVVVSSLAGTFFNYPSSHFSTTGAYAPETTTPGGERGRVRYSPGHTPRQRSTTTPLTTTTTVSPVTTATTTSTEMTTTTTTTSVRQMVSELRYPARSARYEKIR